VKRRVFALLAGSAAFARPPVASAQRSARTYRIGILSLLEAENTTSMKWLVERLLALGYEQERNLVIDFRSASGQPERLQPLAAELVALRPDVLVAGFGTLAAKTVKAATTTIPVVFVTVGDPVGAKVVESLGRPGGNVTGLTDQASDISGKAGAAAGRCRRQDELRCADEPRHAFLGTGAERDPGGGRDQAGANRYSQGQDGRRRDAPVGRSWSRHRRTTGSRRYADAGRARPDRRPCSEEETANCLAVQGVCRRRRAVLVRPRPTPSRDEKPLSPAAPLVDKAQLPELVPARCRAGCPAYSGIAL
jgi:hypothetical protein